MDFKSSNAFSKIFWTHCFEVVPWVNRSVVEDTSMLNGPCIGGRQLEIYISIPSTTKIGTWTEFSYFEPIITVYVLSKLTIFSRLCWPYEAKKLVLFRCFVCIHTPYSWNIMRQKWEGNCGLWFLNEMVLKKYAESLKKIVGAVWELPAK